MNYESDLQYDLAIIGNDAAGLELARRACCELSRVLLITEQAVPAMDCIVGLTHLVGQVRFESEQVLVCETEQGEVSIFASQIVIATGADAIKPRWMSELPNVGFAHENILPAETGKKVAIVYNETIVIKGDEDRFTIDECIIGLGKEGEKIRIFLESGDSIVVDAVIVKETAMRGKTAGLDLHRAGLSVDDRGCLWCNENYETWTPNIFAIGDVVGYCGIECSIAEQVDFVMAAVTESQLTLV